MEPTQISETSAFNTQTPGKYPEYNLSLLQHGESLKTRNIFISQYLLWFEPEFDVVLFETFTATAI
jgi:hypothetical protein